MEQIKFQMSNIKYQTNNNDRNSKIPPGRWPDALRAGGQTKSHPKRFWSPVESLEVERLDIGFCDLFVICLPAVFLAGCLEFVILGTKL
jgi:hypothetical protein